MISATLDSNVLISALLGGKTAWLLAQARNGLFRADTSPAILDENRRRPQGQIRMAALPAHFARRALENVSNVVLPQQSIAVADDPDDDRILECAVTARSDYIVSNDSDLLRLRRYAGIPIITTPDLITLLNTLR